MGWIVFEALLALAVMLALVWWTFRGRAESGADEADSDMAVDESSGQPADKP